MALRGNATARREIDGSDLALPLTGMRRGSAGGMILFVEGEVGAALRTLARRMGVDEHSSVAVRMPADGVDEELRQGKGLAEDIG